ncbi:MAG: iron-sulfur cluster assembly accessory protein [Pseudomonadota bacterium]
MITITENAVKAIKRLQSQQNKPNMAVRLGVTGGGCSGLTYKVDLADEPAEKDRVFEKDGVRVFVDPKSYLYLAGVELDYEESLTQSGFRFNNPNAKSACGCGTSFAV